MNTSKKCTACEALLPIGSFYQTKRGGTTSECKRCLYLRSKEYNERNKEAIVAKRKKHYAENRAVLLERNARWRAKAYTWNTAKRLIYSCRSNAKSRGLDFTITEGDIVVPDVCPVFGIKLEHNKRTLGDSSHSLDRINNAMGYVPGNVIVVSFRANRLKQDASIDDLIRMVNFYSKLNK